jgi:hypothetical protein
MALLMKTFLLGYDATFIGGFLPTFQRSLFPPETGQPKKIKLLGKFVASYRRSAGQITAQAPPTGLLQLSPNLLFLLPATHSLTVLSMEAVSCSKMSVNQQSTW